MSCAPQISEYERSLGECRLLISQHEARCASLAESMREAENKKRQLEEAADALREECARLQVPEPLALCHFHLLFIVSIVMTQ